MGTHPIFESDFDCLTEMSSAIFGKLAKDVKIKIKRSNGVVHAATITSLVEENHTVNVEWFEKEDVKGKELSVNAVLDLNPEFRLADEPAPSVSRSVREASQPNIARKSILIPSSKARLKKENIQPSSQSRISVASHSQSRIAKPSSSSSAVPKTGLSRKSEAVRAVEKIERDRADRRENQQKARYQRDQQRSKHDVNDKQWEFAQMIDEWKEDNELQHNRNRPGEVRICVCVRKRPLNGKENRNKETDIISRDANVCIVHQPQQKVDLTKYLEHQKFRFDYTFDADDDNKKVYEYTAKPMIEAVFEGAMATCFAYGQTGSGKTHTMGGEFSGKNQNCRTGIYALSSAECFHKLKRHPELRLEVSFFEIYSNKVYDLLNKKSRLNVLEDKSGNIRIVNLSNAPVNSVDDVIDVLAEGSKCRTSGQTSASSNSSRSHAVFQLILMKGKKMHGTFSLIDLAGNERGADTMQSDRQTKLEGTDINKSLLCLKECIRAMGKDARHVPFRGSTLTKVLRDSFIGDRSKTCMIANISPGFTSCENTLNTLRYADRVKGLSVNEKDNDYLDPLMEESNESIQEEEISRDQMCIDMLASNNSEEFSPLMAKIAKQQQIVDQSEEKVLDYWDDWNEWMVGTLKEMQNLREDANKPDFDQLGFADQMINLMSAMPSETNTVQKAFMNYKSRVEELEQLLEEKNEAPPVQSRSNLPPSARRQIASAQSRRK